MAIAGYYIKEYFANYFLHSSDVTIDLSSNEINVHHRRSEPWKVTLIDTGEQTMTGGRLKRVADHVAGEEAFCFTYGDGVADIDIGAQIAFHRDHGKLATVTAVRPPGRYGALDAVNGQVQSFIEKPRGDGALINGGFFVLSPEVIRYIADDTTIWEAAPLEMLARKGELMAFEHLGFWQPMDTLREKNLLEGLWTDGRAAWKTW